MRSHECGIVEPSLIDQSVTVCGESAGGNLAAAGVPGVLHNAGSLVHGYLGYAGVVPAATEATELGLSALKAALHG